MQKHIEMDEPEEAVDLETTLFGAADPVGSVIGEEMIDEEAVDDELEEDQLTVEDEDEIAEADPGAEDEAPPEEEA